MNSNSNQEFNVGDIIEVTITSFTNFGAFSETSNGYKGLIHISNIANEFVKNPSDYFSINDVVKAEVITIDNESKKLGLSTKQFDLKSKKRSFNNSYSNNRKYNKF